MNELDQKLLAIIQDGFPVVERPYKALADTLNVSEQEVFDAVEMLRASGVIRRIGGVYDSKKLGFISRLCAGMVPTSSQDFSTESHDETPMEKFAAVVMGEPAITHNYIRSHEYNVWFTVIAENEAAIETVVERVCAKTELHDVHVLSATKKYKIDTVMGASAPVVSRLWLVNRVGDESVVTERHSERSEESSNFRGNLSESDKSRIRIACGDIPHSLTPFKDWGVSCDELREDHASRRMRRFGAILRHQNAGFAFNAMVCFRLNEEPFADSRHSDNPALRHSDNRRLEESSKVLVLAKKHYVSHCYERPSFEKFPYNLYAMMHAPSAELLSRYIEDAAKSIDNSNYVVLNSLRELKKTSFGFFL
ncbi:MAG: Lrp/AsnC family transcriptional regulator [Fibrobacter sp.]|nr:Lrp/AsnC family transcriptional regulator [Fibrobacter sp.]